VFTYLKHYIYQTRDLRVKNGLKENKLFISFKKPYGAVSKDTISRWINIVMEQAGVDVKCFKPHSTRSASTSAADKLGVPVATILKTAGWSNEATFQKYYNKPVVCSKDGIANALLTKS
jgi:integrase